MTRGNFNDGVSNAETARFHGRYVKFADKLRNGDLIFQETKL
jgi:hypothetical protein